MGKWSKGTERQFLGGFENEFKAHDVHELAQAVEAWVAFFGEHLEHVFSAEAGFFRELTNTAVDLGHVSESDEKIAVVTVFHARVEIPHRAVWVF